MARRRKSASAPPTPKGRACYRVKIALRGAGMIYVLSSTKPEVETDGGTIAAVRMTPMEESEYGDTLAYVCWSDVSVVAWRPARIGVREGDTDAEGGHA